MGNTVKLDYEGYGFVRIGKTANTKTSVYCKSCPLVLVNSTKDRLSKHQLNCPKSGGSLLHQHKARKPCTPSSKACSDDSSDDGEPPAKRSIPSTPTTNVQNGGESSIASTPTINMTPSFSGINKPKQSFLATDRMGKEQGRKFKEDLTDFFLANRVAFRIVDDNYFRKLLTNLRPACEKFIPSRQHLGSKLLDDALARYAKMDVSNTEVDTCLLVDGWKNKVTADKWFCLVLHRATGHTSYLHSELMTGIAEEGVRLAQIIHAASIKAKQDLKVIIYCVVSDNAANMVTMGEEVAHVMWHVRCNSHTGNLLSKDCFTLNQELLDIIKSIQVKFKANFQQLVKKMSGKAVILSCETRWGTVLKMYENFIHNLDTYKDIASKFDKKKALDDDMKKQILGMDLKRTDKDLRERVNEEIAIQRPIVDLITISQGKQCNLSQIAEVWLKLKEKIPGNCSKKVKDALNARESDALCDVTLAAYFFDVNRDRSLLTQWQKIKVEKFVNQYLRKIKDRDALNAFADFKEKGKDLNPIADDNYEIDARLFWSSMSYEHPGLSKLAIRLLNIPASSSEIERVFSKWREVHSTLRNRLGAEKSEKLLRAYYFLHGNRPEKKENTHSEANIEDDIMEAVNFTDYVRTTLDNEDDIRFVEEIIAVEE